MILCATCLRDARWTDGPGVIRPAVTVLGGEALCLVHAAESGGFGCEPGCRHKCAACRAGLVTHLACDPRCESGGFGSEGER